MAAPYRPKAFSSKGIFFIPLCIGYLIAPGFRLQLAPGEIHEHCRGTWVAHIPAPTSVHRGVFVVRAAVAILFVPLLWACAPAQPLAPNLIEQNPRLPIALNMRNANLVCESGTSCPENVGYILSNVSKNYISRCTGWLIAPDVIATNSHCIPDDMKQDAGKCVGNMSIKFPATNGLSEEVLECAGILFHSEITLDKKNPTYGRKADYAFFRLKTPSKRRVIKTSRAGIADLQELAIYSIDPQPQLAGKVVKRVCRSYKFNNYIPSDKLATSEVVAGFDGSCLAVPGNSGSPVLNTAGEAVGWLHAGILKEHDPEQGVDKSLLLGKLKRPVMLTNLACLPPHPALPKMGAPGPDCTPERQATLMAEANQKEIRRLTDAIVSDFQKAHVEWLPKASNVFKLRASVVVPVLDRQGKEVRTQVSLDCIRPTWGPANEVASYAAVPAKNGTPAKLLGRIGVPTFQVTMKLDPYWRWRATAFRGVDVGMSVSIDPAKVRGCGDGDLSFEHPFSITFQSN